MKKPFVKYRHLIRSYHAERERLRLSGTSPRTELTLAALQEVILLSMMPKRYPLRVPPDQSSCFHLHLKPSRKHSWLPMRLQVVPRMRKQIIIH